MMLYPAMRDLLKKVPSRYQLVNVVACRAREIAIEAEREGEPLGTEQHGGNGGKDCTGEGDLCH